MTNTSHFNSTFNTRGTDNAEVLHDMRSDAYIFTLIVVYSFFGTIGLFGNFLVTVVVCRSRPMRNPTNFLLASVAMSDFAFCLTATPNFIIVTLWEKVLTYKQHIKLEKFARTGELLYSIFSVTSTITLSLLAIERYNALVHPMKVHRRLDKRNSKIAIVVIWIIAVLLVTPYGIGLGVVYTDGARVQSFQDFFPTFHLYLLILYTLVYVISLIAVAFCYGKIIFGIYVVRNICSERSSKPHDIKNRKRLVKMLLLVTLVFIASHLPSVFSLTYHMFRNTIQIDIFTAVTILSYLSPCLNPIVYVTCNTNYREGVKRLLKGCLSKETSPRSPSWRLETS